MRHYRWASWGDVNAFFGLMLDNVAVMIILFSTITAADAATAPREGSVRFTASFVLTRMIPGTALGVLLGDAVYTFLAFRLARRSGRADVTAMPLGLDTPSTFGVAFLVLLPALQDGYRAEHDHARAMEFAWHVGLTMLVLVGLFKTACAPFGNLIRKLVPRAGLLGSLAAIALALIAFLPLLLDGIASVPLVGMASLAIILWTLVAHRDLPGRFPGALGAVLVGVVIYQGCRALGQATGWPLVPPASPLGTTGGWEPAGLLSFYGSSSDWRVRVFEAALAKMPVVLPFALATIVGGIDCTESAAAAGDEFDTRAILLTEGIAALVAGLLGGVIQTTPYIGHPAYKKMGGRAAYTAATALFVGAVGYFGGFTLLFDWLPRAAMFPILVFVGLEITAQSFHATPVRHYPALALAMMPALAYLITVPLGSALGGRDPAPGGLEVVQTLRCLANGFIVTSLLWAAALAMLIDGKLLSSAAYFGSAGLCALFGVIHSPLPNERIGLPQDVMAQVARKEVNLPALGAGAVGLIGSPGPGPLLAGSALAAEEARQPPFLNAVRYQTPYHWAGAYGLVVLLLLGLSLSRTAHRNGAKPSDWEAEPHTDAAALPEVPPAPATAATDNAGSAGRGTV